MNPSHTEIQVTIEEDKNYFFSFLIDRFEEATWMWRDALEERFGGDFEPIFVMSAKQNDLFNKDNYIILSNHYEEDHIWMEEFEDLNRMFSSSEEIFRLTDELLETQEEVFVLGFTSAFLDTDNPDIRALGPDPGIATRYDSKVEQVRLFEELGVPHPEATIYDSLDGIREEDLPMYVTAEYTSGGFEAGFARSLEDLGEIAENMRRINEENRVVGTRLIDTERSPNVNALTTGKGTQVICITDQVLRGNAYLGNVWPSSLDANERQRVVGITRRIGEHLAVEGFRGVWGLDFVVDGDGKAMVVDLNPRRQGGYLCNILAWPEERIVYKELALALGEDVKLGKDLPEAGFAWAHSKIKPKEEREIAEIFRTGTSRKPFKSIGTTHKAIFYQKGKTFYGSCAGYYITTGKSREEVKARMENDVKDLIKESLTTTPSSEKPQNTQSSIQSLHS